MTDDDIAGSGANQDSKNIGVGAQWMFAILWVCFAITCMLWLVFYGSGDARYIVAGFVALPASMITALLAFPLMFTPPPHRFVAIAIAAMALAPIVYIVST